MKMSGSLVVLLMAAIPAQAQEGPSFNCEQAGTATELAICASPWLARLERRTVASYEELAGRIGDREARALADGHLALRQACQGDRACIEDRLVSATQAFEAEGRVATVPADEGREPAIARRERSPTPPAETSDVPPLVAQVPRPVARPSPGPWREAAVLERGPTIPWDVGLDLDRSGETMTGAAPEPLADPTPALPTETLALNQGGDARSGEANPDLAPAPEAEMPLTAPFDPTPLLTSLDEALGGSASVLSDAFSALPVYRRANLQGRLVDAGYGDLDPDGTWTVATATAFSFFALDASVGRSAFDTSTPEGAAALFDFIDSDRFKREFLGEAVSAELEW